MTTYEQLTIDGSPTAVVGFAITSHLDTVLDQLVTSYGFDAVEAALGGIKIAMSGPIPQIGQRTDDQRTSIGHRSQDLRRFSAGSYCGRMLVAFNHERHYGLTDAEVTTRILSNVDYTVSQWEGCRRRASDLRAAGYIADSGTERENRIVWLITPEGRRAVQTLVNTGWSR